MCIFCNLLKENEVLLDHIKDMMERNAPGSRELKWGLANPTLVDPNGNRKTFSDTLLVYDDNTKRVIAPLGTDEIERNQLLYALFVFLAHAFGIDNLTFEQREQLDKIKHRLNDRGTIVPIQPEPETN